MSGTVEEVARISRFSYDNTADDKHSFGESVALWRDTATGSSYAFVGAVPRLVTEKDVQGSVYVYQRAASSKEWQTHGRFQLTPIGTDRDDFGIAMVVDGDRLAVIAAQRPETQRWELGQVLAVVYDLSTLVGDIDAGQQFPAPSTALTSSQVAPHFAYLPRDASIAMRGNLIAIRGLGFNDNQAVAVWDTKASATVPKLIDLGISMAGVVASVAITIDDEVVTRKEGLVIIYPSPYLNNLTPPVVIEPEPEDLVYGNTFGTDIVASRDSKAIFIGTTKSRGAATYPLPGSVHRFGTTTGSWAKDSARFSGRPFSGGFGTRIALHHEPGSSPVLAVMGNDFTNSGADYVRVYMPKDGASDLHPMIHHSFSSLSADSHGEQFGRSLAVNDELLLVGHAFWGPPETPGGAVYAIDLHRPTLP